MPDGKEAALLHLAGENAAVILQAGNTRTNGLPAGTITASGGTSIGGDRGRIPAGRILIRGGAVTGGERRGSPEAVTIVPD